jgi:large subunit ribosomal protein L4
VFGPKPRSYQTDLNRKVKRLARQSALNARANEKRLYVIEALEFDGPKTRRMVELLESLGIDGLKVLILTADARPEVYLSGRNLPAVQVARYADVSVYDVLWSDVLLVEQAAIGGHAVKGAAKATAGRAARAKRASERGAKKKTTKSAKKATKKKKG